MTRQSVKSERHPETEYSTEEEERKNQLLLELNVGVGPSQEPDSQAEERNAAYQMRPNIALKT